MLITVVLAAALMIGVAMLFCLWRLIKGPDITDRILALDTLYINSIALIILLGLYHGSALYFEGALLIAMLGFVSTAALAKYLLRGDIIE
ncbi:MAG: K+/H+ antiporter subunit F [Thalassolituus sp.]|jgi:multicomponent K+:H+ antiporter subunit F|uniref:K+/H+ antiporter subunit F n=1 Tax=Thalassolituus sp. TaxID=2030822 RepID=UPI00261CB915|nr:K+/H+ antiporter subunit F [uncultured Thalassolituus sp.]TNC91741.1 MAG: K+/H+ antiporter subunit F [Thalassolituus sp.]